MRSDRVQRALAGAVEDLIAAHQDILVRNVNERTIGQHLAMALRRRFQEFDVDCEYNLDVDDESGRKRAYGTDEGPGKLITPDVIVHRRGLNGPVNNILIVELKKHGDRAPQLAHDRKKLRICTANDGRNHLEYSLGALVVIGVGWRIGTYSIEWFTRGEGID